MIYPENEFERVKSLFNLNISFDELADDLDPITRLAALSTGSAIAMVNIIDPTTQWTVSSYGYEGNQMRRENSICTNVILTDKSQYEIENLAEHEIFRDYAYVKGGPQLKFYSGVTLSTSDGHKFGTLCVLDTEPGSLDEEQKSRLRSLAKLAETIIHQISDINTLKEENAELARSFRKLGHDLRSPVNGILGVAEMMLMDVDEGNYVAKEDIKLIQDGAQSVLDLSKNIMEGSSVKDESTESYTIQEFLEHLKDLYQPQAVSKNVTLSLKSDTAEHELTFSKSRVSQIAGNLISNSIKFTPKEGSVEVQISHKSTDNDTGHLTISVRDTGIGLTDKQIEKILNETPTSSTGTTGESGYGFGLPLVQHLISQSKGSLDIESEPEAGSHFKVTIPV